MVKDHCQDLRNSCLVAGLVLDLVVGQDPWSVSACLDKRSHGRRIQGSSKAPLSVAGAGLHRYVWRSMCRCEVFSSFRCWHSFFGCSGKIIPSCVQASPDGAWKEGIWQLGRSCKLRRWPYLSIRWRPNGRWSYVASRGGFCAAASSLLVIQTPNIPDPSCYSSATS